jgi:hypothetical protein
MKLRGERPNEWMVGWLQVTTVLRKQRILVMDAFNGHLTLDARSAIHAGLLTRGHNARRDDRDYTF